MFRGNVYLMPHVYINPKNFLVGKYIFRTAWVIITTKRVTNIGYLKCAKSGY